MPTNHVNLRFVFVAVFFVSIPMVVQSDELSEKSSDHSTSVKRQAEKRSYTSLDEARLVARQSGRPILAVFR